MPGEFLIQHSEVANALEAKLFAHHDIRRMGVGDNGSAKNSAKKAVKSAASMGAKTTSPQA